MSSGIPPAPWRVVGDLGERDEAFIPVAPGRGKFIEEVFRRMTQPSIEELEDRRLAREAREVAKETARASILARHEVLVAVATEPIVLRLLAEHKPERQEDDWWGTGLECRACPKSSHDDEYEGWVEFFQEAPCPTWKAIDQDLGAA